MIKKNRLSIILFSTRCMTNEMTFIIETKTTKVEYFPQTDNRNIFLLEEDDDLCFRISVHPSSSFKNLKKIVYLTCYISRESSPTSYPQHHPSFIKLVSLVLSSHPKVTSEHRSVGQSVNPQVRASVVCIVS